MAGRNVKPGITFYRMDSGHILNPKIRLLCNEFDSDGYFIWSCLIDYAYNQWGYYFDINDKDKLELFASEYCKKKLTQVKEVINGCIRRDLFDKRVADLFGVLTSEMMQDVYVYATAERRRQGSIFTINNEWLVDEFKKIYKSSFPVNFELVHVNNSNSSREESIDKTKQDKTRQNNFVAPEAAQPPLNFLKKKTEQPPEPFWESLVKVWFDFGIEKFKTEPSFKAQDPKIFKKIIEQLKSRAEKKKIEWNEKTAPERLLNFLDHAFSDEWLSKNFLLKNLDTQFDKIIQDQAKVAMKKETPVPRDIEKDLEFLYERFVGGEQISKLLLPEHYDFLENKGCIELDDQIKNDAWNRRMNQLIGSNQRKDMDLFRAYQSMNPEHDLVKTDAVNFMKLAKKLAVMNYLKVKQERA